MRTSPESTSELTGETLQRFAEENRELIENNPQMNEEETKAAIITDFVNLLGWEIPQDGNMEYQFGDHNTNVVDYAFFHNGTSKLFVEAKSQGTTLREKHQNQLKEYLVLDNVDLGILTNGEVYELYRRFVNEEGNVETQRIDRVALPDFPEYATLINIFSKPQVTDETYVERLKRINDIRIARDTLEENREQIATQIQQVITDSVGDIAEQPATNRTAAFLDAIDEDLAGMAPTGSPDETQDESDSVSTTEDSVSTGRDASQIEMTDEAVVVDEKSGEPLFPVTNRDAISDEDSTKIGVYASDFGRGLPFIVEHSAWGFINIASEPEYFCIYVNRPYQQIQLIGVVEHILSKDEFLEDRDLDRDPTEIADSKKAIEFSEVYQLENPIPLGNSSSKMQGLLYTTMEEFQTATTTDEL